MARPLLRSVLDLRIPLRRPLPAQLLSIQSRSFNTTPPIIEPSSSSSSSVPQDAIPEAFASKQALTNHTSPSHPYSPPTESPPRGPLDQSVRELLPLLAAQPNHYITFHIYGRPYLVTPGDTVRLPFKMPGVLPGDVLRLDRASVLGSRDFTLKGSPYIDERLFECRAVVTGSELEPMRIKIKKKQRTRRGKRVESQLRFTTLAIQELKVRPLEEIEG